jgi:inosine-uridine nucleoside N-ribohydrolase
LTVPILFDTDMDTDCDDVGALAVLHALEQRGEARILGVVCDVPDPWAAACAQAVNHAAGRAEIPVGIVTGEDLAGSARYHRYCGHLASLAQWGWGRYNKPIGQDFRCQNPTAPPPLDAVDLYRQVLAAQEDHSVVIAAVGLLTALQKLLASPPDAHSPLNGEELVRAKAKRLVTMGLGTFPHGEDGFNWRMDSEAAAAVLNHWPAPLTVSAWGADIHTGASLAEQTSPGNPVRRAYELFLQGPSKSRSSWDLVAVLFAVRGPGDLFREISGSRIHFDPRTGKHQWVQGASGPAHTYFHPVVSNEALARVLETLMISGASPAIT